MVDTLQKTIQSDSGISKDAVAPSALTNQVLSHLFPKEQSAETSQIKDILVLPTLPNSSDKPRSNRNRDLKTKCLNLSNDLATSSKLNLPLPYKSVAKNLKPNLPASSKHRRGRKRKSGRDDDWGCGICSGGYSEDTKN